MFPVWLIPSAIGAAIGWGMGGKTSAPDPIASLTNLLIIGTVLFVGLKVLKRI